MCVAGTPHAHPHPDAAPTNEGFDRRSFLRRVVLAGAGAALAGAVPLAGVAAGEDRSRRFRDLSHVFRAGSPVYTFDNPTRETVVTIPANGFYAQKWTFAEHSGTHLDAPGHFVVGNRLADELEPHELFAPIVVVDIADRVAGNPDAEVLPRDLRRFERRHGRIPDGAIVAMYSGWETRFDSQDAYRNADPSGVFHFPGFSLAAAEWLLERRNIRAIGVDTLSLDNGPSTTFAVHVAVLGADRYGLENLRNLSAIPARGATAFVGLIPWEQGSGGPARVVATWS
jgi:kynurenine formamidase